MTLEAGVANLATRAGQEFKRRSWLDLARGWQAAPQIVATITDGDVYRYVYSSSIGNVTYYRLVPSGGADDAFYENFNGSALSGLIAKRELEVI